MQDTPWVSSEKACKSLGIDEETLHFWRKVGYLKPGTHWRSIVTISDKKEELKIFYRLNWCIEEMEYWRSHDAAVDHFAAYI